MKKQIIVWLLAGAASQFHALSQPYFVPNATPVSQSVFGPTDPGKQQCNFFVWLPQKNRIWLDLFRLSHLDKIPDLDSLIEETSELLKPYFDSFSADGYTRRIEMDATRKPVLFRIITHDKQPRAFTKEDDEMVIVKIDQDTIRIKFWGDDGYYGSYINLLLNNVSDLASFEPKTGSKSLDVVKKGVQENYRIDARFDQRFNFYATFNLETGKLVSPSNYHAIRTGKQYIRLGIEPSVAYARGQGLVGLSMGASYTYGVSRGPEGSQLSFGIYWEPQFSYKANTDGKIQGYRNDFISLRFREIKNAAPYKFMLTNTMSIGYLLRNRGNVFESNTFKLGFPGLQNGYLHIEPELYFNDFFKNISPGLRMSLQLF
ncbi:MAG: hypothetical protein MUE99_07315 [Chitinophagaceae bacterium]|nr:hypothetical protein [Chitinophagaceae bacterium]